MMTLLLLWLLRRRRRAGRALLLGSFAVLAGCASAPGQDARDPYEPLNRKVFAINEAADRAVLSPLARGYRKVTPGPVRRGISNLLANLSDLAGAVNSGLQGRGRRAGSNGARFAINSTLGIFGLFDVASPLGIARYRTDFGETLAVWGVEQGPYLMLPLLGPSTARAGFGGGVDFMLQPYWQSGGALLPVVGAVDSRAALLGSEALITGDRYLFIREAYLQRRAAQLGEESRIADFAGEEEQFDWGE